MKYSVLLFGLLLGFISKGQNTVCFNIENNPNTNISGLSPFTKYVNVLDCFSVYAESTISDAKVLHAAAVAAELLDNDENGFVDDPALKSALQSSDALIPIFSQENSTAENQFSRNIMEKELQRCYTIMKWHPIKQAIGEVMLQWKRSFMSLML
jgi:hypothetical protein